MNDAAKTIPTLCSLNIKDTQTFYEETLGFTCESVGEDYLIAKRDEIELHFQLSDDTQLPKNTTCYIRGDQISDLYQEYSKQNIKSLTSFEVRPWNMKEFHIHDPYGNLLRFGCCPA